jgi:glycosyltransferase involved in cell wall biosynthesis
MAAWLARTPCIFHTYHGHVFRSYFGPAKTRFYLALEQLCGTLSTRVLTVSDNLKRELGEVYHVAPPGKVEVLVPGYDLRGLLPVQRGAGNFRTQFGIPQDAPLAGIVGRLVPIKNHTLFLEAAQRTRQALPAARFAIVGDGELRADIEAQAAALGLGECVHFTGWVHDLPSIFGALDALVLCSKNEGLPSSVIEALVTGVPVVATAVGGVVDMLAGGLGALTPPGDAEALAEAMVQALGDPAARVRAEARRDQAYEQYDIRPATDRAAAFYRRFTSPPLPPT